MTGLRTLVQIEWIKIRSRPAVWISTLIFTGLVGLLFAAPLYLAIQGGQTPTAFPEAWHNIFGGIPPLGLFFTGAVVIFLISSEFGWRTARQNIIDGLARGEWFRAKIGALVLIVALFCGIQLVVGGAFGIIGTVLAGPGEGPIIRATDLASLGGFGLGVLGIASLAFAIAFLARGSGSALAIFFLYISAGEGVITALLNRVELLAPLARYLPVTVFGALQQRETFDPEYHALLTELSLEAGHTPPLPVNTPLTIALGCIYTAALIGAAYLVYRRRDL